MILIDDIYSAYPGELHQHSVELVREYLQYEIVKLIYSGKFAHCYTLQGDACLRICYGKSRFSEDLDFDNVGLDQADFEATAKAIQLGLQRLGFDVSISFTYKGAFHCKIRFPALLHTAGLSPHKEARMLIKLDTEKQHYEYERALISIDKFGVQTEILAVPKPLLASQKIAAIMGRKRPKGRDFYDLAWLLKQVKPDYGYLEDRFKVTTEEGLRAMVIERIAEFDFSTLANDVRPFLFSLDDLGEVENFPEYWKRVSLV